MEILLDSQKTIEKKKLENYSNVISYTLYFNKFFINPIVFFHKKRADIYLANTLCTACG